MTETGSHWLWSCHINRCLGGRRGQPLCARAWANGWQCFIECMALAFRSPVHCEEIFIRWQAQQAYDPTPIKGRSGPSAGY